MGNTTHFFLGANSGQGFQNLFDKFCGAEEHYDLLVLKGGPGAGKSTMMRRIGEAMEKRGESVEYLYCSGDPASLDGVHIPSIHTAVVDGTAPHVVEPRYPAAVERYVNLGQFYDIGAAKAAREEIMRCTNECSEAYRRAYRALSAARQVEESANSLVAEGMDFERLKRRTAGIISREIRGKGDGGSDRFRFLGSITCKGAVWRFDSVETLCPRIYQLHDNSGLAAPMLEQIHEAALARGYEAIRCPDAEHMHRLQHLLLPELGTAFVTTKSGMECDCPAYRRIHLDAMVPSAHMKRWKGRLKLLRKLSATLREEGVAALREAKAAHDSLEALYYPHVDFDGVNELTALEIKRIESYL